MFRKLWNDEAGAIVSAEIVLVATILVIGMVVGLKSVRDAVVTELADVAQAIGNIDQSYSFSGVTGHQTATAGGYFLDAADFCDTSTSSDDQTDSKCVHVGVGAASAIGAEMNNK